MKLYISGDIAADPNFRSKFKHWQKNLEAAGFETVNPVDVGACPEQSCGGEIADTDLDDETTTEYLHSWACYMRYGIAAMMLCNGVAALFDAVESPGARTEMYLAGLVGIPVKPIRTWISEVINQQLRTASPRPIRSEAEFLVSMDAAIENHFNTKIAGF